MLMPLSDTVPCFFHYQWSGGSGAHQSHTAVTQLSHGIGMYAHMPSGSSVISPVIWTSHSELTDGIA